MFMAYIDPGSAGTIIGQSGGIIIAFLGGLVGMIVLFFRRTIGSLFKKLGKFAIVTVAVLVPALVYGAYLLCKRFM